RQSLLIGGGEGDRRRGAGAAAGHRERRGGVGRDRRVASEIGGVRARQPCLDRRIRGGGARRIRGGDRQRRRTLDDGRRRVDDAHRREALGRVRRGVGGGEGDLRVPERIQAGGVQRVPGPCVEDRRNAAIVGHGGDT